MIVPDISFRVVSACADGTLRLTYVVGRGCFQILANGRAVTAAVHCDRAADVAATVVGSLERFGYGVDSCWFHFQNYLALDCVVRGHASPFRKEVKDSGERGAVLSPADIISLSTATWLEGTERLMPGFPEGAF